MMTRFLMAMATLAALTAAPARASSIVVYNLAAANAGTSLIVGVLSKDPGVAASPLVASGPDILPDPFNVPNGLFYGGWTTGPVENTLDSFQWTVTPLGGMAVSYCPST